MAKTNKTQKRAEVIKVGKVSILTLGCYSDSYAEGARPNSWSNK